MVLMKPRGYSGGGPEKSLGGPEEVVDDVDLLGVVLGGPDEATRMLLRRSWAVPMKPEEVLNGPDEAT